MFIEAIAVAFLLLLGIAVERLQKIVGIQERAAVGEAWIGLDQIAITRLGMDHEQAVGWQVQHHRRADDDDVIAGDFLGSDADDLAGLRRHCAGQHSGSDSRQYCARCHNYRGRLTSKSRYRLEQRRSKVASGREIAGVSY